MIAFVLLAMAAVVIYPVFIQAKKKTKFGDSRQACQSIVRGKLEEYKGGRFSQVSDAANSAGTYSNLPAKPGLGRLTMTNFSSTSVRSIGNVRSVENSRASDGFLYSKIRYNRYFPFACMGQSQAVIFQGRATAPPRLGMRECIGTARAWYEDPREPNATLCTDSKLNIADLQANSMIPGFKLYVKLELNTPWLFNVEVEPQFLNSCPNFGDWGSAVEYRRYFSGFEGGQPRFAYEGAPLPTSLYDFDGSGDSIKVTVTGVMDFPSVSRGIQDLGGITAAIPERLMCSASAIVSPQSYSVRYYLTRTGRILSVHGHGANGSENQTDEGGWVLRNLYTQPDAPPEFGRHSGIISFAVHPRNLSVYVLKRGTLLRYGNCGGVPLNCIATGRGLSDQGNVGWPALQEFQISPSVVSIGVDFRRGAIYGLLGDKNEIVRIVQRGARGLSLTDLNGVAMTADQIELQLVARGEFPRLLPLSPGPGILGPEHPFRMNGFFISPDGNDAFMTDLTSTGVFQDTGDRTGSGSYSSAIYRIQDTKLLSPIERFPFDAISFSK